MWTTLRYGGLPVEQFKMCRMLTDTQQQAKLGISLSVEPNSEEMQEQAEAVGAQATPNIPF
jgi:mitochondrial import receptor subunit TOM40